MSFVSKVIVDVQTRSFHVWDDEGEVKTVDCGDDYDAFCGVLEFIRNEPVASQMMKYVPPSDFLSIDSEIKEEYH